MNPIKFLSCLSLLLLHFSAAAQLTEDTLLLQYRRMALEYNDELKAAGKSIDAGTELERAARALRFPELSANGDAGYTVNPLEYSAEITDIGQFAIRGQHWKYGASVTLTQPVYEGGRINGEIRKAETETRMRRNRQEILSTDVCLRTDIQYWTTVARRERVSIAEEYLNTVSDLERIVKERVEAGLCDMQDLLTVEVRHNEARYRLLQAKGDLETGLMALNALIGLPLETETPVSGCVEYINPDLCPMTDSMEHTEITLAKENVELARINMRLNDSGYLPQFRIGINAGYYAPGYDFRPDLSPNCTVYAQLSVPIFHGGKRYRERRAAKYGIGMAEDLLHSTETDIELKIRTARTALQEADGRVALAMSSLEKARENERRATEKYTEGTIPLSDVIDAQFYRQTAQENLLKAKTEVKIHLAELLKATDSYRLQ